jgi:hypothetical protein
VRVSLEGGDGRPRANIAEHGCLQPLVVWAETETLLDGHTRLDICRELRKPYKVVQCSFPSRDAARNWIIENQLGRRNLTPERAAYLRGKRMLCEKRDPALTQVMGNSRLRQSGGAGEETAVRVAAGSNVSPRTVERDAVYARAIDRIAEAGGHKLRAVILSGDVKLTRQQVLDAAERAPRTVQQLLEVKRSSIAMTPRVEIERRASQLLHLLSMHAEDLATEPVLAALNQLRDAINGLHVRPQSRHVEQGAS